MGYFTERRFEMPVYVRHMPKHMTKFPDRDYSVNRAERRKRNKKKQLKEE